MQPSTLARLCRDLFDASDQRKGDVYFQRGHVDLWKPLDRHVGAMVRGGRKEPYWVELTWTPKEGGRLDFWCDCPQFHRASRCKHVWAAILAADAECVSAILLRDPDFDGSDAYAQTSMPVATDSGHRHPVERAAPPPADWRLILERARPASYTDRWPSEARALGSRRRQLFYVIDIPTCFQQNKLVVKLYQRVERQDGELGVIKTLTLDEEEIELQEPSHAVILRLLASLHSQANPPYWEWERSQAGIRDVAIPGPLIDLVLPRLASTGVLLVRKDKQSRPDPDASLDWDDGPPWELQIECEPIDPAGRDGTEAAGEVVQLMGALVREGERVALSAPLVLLNQGVVIFGDRVARLEAPDTFPLIATLRHSGSIEVPREDVREAIGLLAELPRPPALLVPAEDQPPVVSMAPQPQIDFDRTYGHRGHVHGVVAFDYDAMRVSPEDPRRLLYSGDRLIERDAPAESTAFQGLLDLGLERELDDPAAHVIARERDLLKIAMALVDEGWSVKIHGDRICESSGTRVRVESGIDWFDLAGEVDFGGRSVPLPVLLRVLEAGDRLVQLNDGTIGVLPEDWHDRYGVLGRLAQSETEDSLRFSSGQGILLDILLAELPSVDVDADFGRLRRRLEAFSGFRECSEPRGFRGELRPYQREGLGWLRGLSELGLGGCLADDMGLGKTVQMLALLQWRRSRPLPPEDRRPSLLVAPRSLLFNWLQEAERFAPRLRTLAYSGPKRAHLIDRFSESDLVVTTYDTLRRDIATLQRVHFDVVLLDEAQAIKNSSSQRAKVCRVLQADHRFTLTGTPVENSLDDLWSIFEFLNPGLLGRFGQVQLRRGAKKPELADLERIRRALAPLILRRTKQQVLKDLPPKTEQILYCEFSGPQRREYDALRDHYRSQLGGQIQDRGLARSKIHVLEALLRLRQAACHPGLLDASREDESSAKLDILVDHLLEITAEDNKAVVFSQFTSLLSIVRLRLDRVGLAYEYLDGKTRHREEAVQRFQSDPDCPLFLISIKAGGVGLNLTAAGYVFLLDPWWNPAVEAQAIDRCHRIGQSQPVFAYRLITRDTVEEKILQLQAEKRELADAVFGTEESLIRNLTVDDIEALLG